MNRLWRRLSKPLLAALLLGAVSVGLTTAALARQAATNGKAFEYAVGLWGDAPYNDVQATIGVPNLIADMNSQDLAFSVHAGDLKAGSGVTGSTTPTSCADALYTQGLAYLNQLKAPAAFTPGDNDWTDCDRPANGGFNSLERLDHERQVFFGTSFTAGQQKLQQEVQTDLTCLGYVSGPATGPTVTKPAPCVENRRWTVKGVTYATVNIQGSCNNLCDTAPNPAEYAARNAADIAWLQQTFAQAKANGSAGVMIIGQANPGFDLSDGTRTPLRDPKTLAQTDNQPDGFQSFLVELRNQTIAFGRPVVYVHGDSHYFRVDKPLLDAQGRRLENFTRVETFGDNAANGTNDVQWVKALVDPKSRDVFAFQAQIVPGNRVAVPAPPPLDPGDTGLQSQVTVLTSGPFQFGAWNAGQCSGFQAISIRNEGPGALTGGDATISDPDAADFKFQNGAQRQAIPPLGPQQTYTLLVQFCPSRVGTETATLTIPGDNLTTPPTIRLTGNGKVK